MHPCNSGAGSLARPEVATHALVSVLPDVGAPPELLMIALLGLVITAAGVVAMMMGRR